MESARIAAAKAREYRNFKKNLAEALKEEGLTPSQWAILGCLEDAPKVTTLADDLGTSMAFVTTTTKLLEAKGLLTRAADKKDSRAINLRINTRLVNAIDQRVSKRLAEAS